MAVIAATVAPLLQIKVTAAGVLLAVNTTLPPAQKVVGPDGVMVVTGLALTVTVTPLTAEPVHPAAVVTVTLYVPETVAVMAAVVAPVVHK